MFFTLAEKLLLIWLTTNCESELMNNLFTCISFESLRPASNASYSVTLFEAWKWNLMAQLSLYPSKLIKIILAPEPVLLEDPSTIRFQARGSDGSASMSVS